METIQLNKKYHIFYTDKSVSQMMNPERKWYLTFCMIFAFAVLMIFITFGFGFLIMSTGDGRKAGLILSGCGGAFLLFWYGAIQYVKYFYYVCFEEDGVTYRMGGSFFRHFIRYEEIAAVRIGSCYADFIPGKRFGKQGALFTEQGCRQLFGTFMNMIDDQGVYRFSMPYLEAGYWFIIQKCSGHIRIVKQSGEVNFPDTEQEKEVKQQYSGYVN